MKKLILFLVLFLPILLTELFLHLDVNFYKKILLHNSIYTEWKQAAPRMNYWPEILVFGTSVGRQSINPDALEKGLRNNGYVTSVGNVAINASSTSNDYLTLERILATCKKCPKVILYQVTDLSLKKKEIWLWEHSTLQRILLLYFPNDRIDTLLENAARMDSFYKQYLTTLNIEKTIRTTFTGGRFIGYVFFNSFYEPTFQDKDKEIYSYESVIDESVRKRSLSYARDELHNYEIGGAPYLFFDHFVNLAEDNGIEVIFVLPPQNHTYLEIFNKEHEVFKNFLISYAAEKDIAIIDHSRYLSWDDMYFHDLTHLNTKGSKLYSEYLGKNFHELIER